MAKKNRFSAHKFCAAWKQHGPNSKNWDEFVVKMTEASGSANYPVDQIRERLDKYSTELKAAGIKAPKYPKPRTPSSVAFFSKN